MSQSAAKEQPLKLRGRLVASHQIPVITTNRDEFERKLAATIAKAPALFENAPCVLDLSACELPLDQNSLQQLVEACRRFNLVPFALTGEKQTHFASATALNLAWLEHKAGQNPKSKATVIEKTMVIETPVRSGQQIYAKDANLLIMNQVSAGAEVAADGNIHIFGTLRGRAIAGAAGLTSAEIVCQQMLAELIAIAGTYLVQDDFPPGAGGARCHLNEDSIVINYL